LRNIARQFSWVDYSGEWKAPAYPAYPAYRQAGGRQAARQAARQGSPAGRKTQKTADN